MSEDGQQRRLSAILAADVAGYTRLVEQDPDGTAAAWQAARADINEQIVLQGWALACRQYSMDYVSAEKAAKSLSEGLWKGQFVPPWDWRRGKRLAKR